MCSALFVSHTQPRHADISNNDGGVHAWDEGWAFYTGSLEGTDVGGSADGGQMIYALAEKRCENFGTCDTAGVSEVNNELLTRWEAGRDHLAAGECSAAADLIEEIVPLMAVPLIQGVLRCVLCVWCGPSLGVSVALALSAEIVPSHSGDSKWCVEWLMYLTLVFIPACNVRCRC